MHKDNFEAKKYFDSICTKTKAINYEYDENIL